MRKNSPTVMLLICFSLVVSLFAASPVNDQAKAQSYQQPEQLRKLSSDLLERTGGMLSGGQRIKAILQLKENPRRQLNALLNRNGVHVTSHFDSFKLKAVELPVSDIEELVRFSEVTYGSLDRDLQMLGHIENTTGATAMRQLPGCSGLDGRDIAIAIIDSGIYNDHHSFSGRIVANIDLTDENKQKEDAYGHGTHEARCLRRLAEKIRRK